MERRRARSKLSGIERGQYWEPGMYSYLGDVNIILGSDILGMGIRVREDRVETKQ